MNISVLGGGNMGSALIGGMLKAGVVAKDELRATARSQPTAAGLAERFGIVATAGGNLEAAREADIVILAVKPGSVAKVVREIREVLHERKILISLAAALPIAVIEDSAACRLPAFRAMPNIPVVVAEGPTATPHNTAPTT